MVTDIGVENLVNDHAAHNEAHGGSEGEDESNRRAAFPIVLLEVNESPFGEDFDVVGKP